MKLKQAEWLGKGFYATDKKGNIYFRWDENDKNPILLQKNKNYGRDGQFKYYRSGRWKEYSNYYYTVRIGNTEKYVHTIIAKNYPEICGEWFDKCVVHHINGIKSDNRPENLKIMSAEEHNKWHTKTPVEYDGVKYRGFMHLTDATGIPYWKIIKSSKLKILDAV